MAEPNFDDIEDALIAAELDTRAAEIHGTLTALMLANPEQALPIWYGQLFGDSEVPPSWARDLAEWTGESLADPDFGFRLLLPDDDVHDLPARVEAVSDWVQGLLYGLGLAEIGDLRRQPDDIREMIDDLTRITQVDMDELSDDDDHEDALLQIAEYARTCVFVLRDHFLAERGDNDEPPSPQNLLH